MPNIFNEESQTPDWVTEGEDGADAVEEVTNLDDDEQEAPVAEPQAEAAPPAEPTETAPVESEAVEAVTESASEEPAPVQADQPVEVDWQKRFGDTRRAWEAERQQSNARIEQLEGQNQQLTAAMNKVVPILQQLAKKPPTDDQLAQAGIDPDVYKVAAPLIEREVANRTQGIEQRFAAEAEQRQREAIAAEEQRYNAEVASTVSSFMAEKGIAKESELDGTIGTFLIRLDRESQARGLDPIDLTDRGWLELGLEAAQSPSLRAQLLANPQLVGDDDYVGLARKQAALIDGVQPAAPPSPEQQETEPLPHVVRGSGGPPKKGLPRDDDPLADAKALAVKEQSGIF